jgi:hypothetical protein
MWVFSQDGFISAVDNGAKPGYLAVRARDRKSLVPLSELAESEIEFTPSRDYQYRVYVTREMFQDFMQLSIETLDYKNFKDRLKVSRGSKFAQAAGTVWATMHDVTDAEYNEWYADQYNARTRG